MEFPDIPQITLPVMEYEQRIMESRRGHDFMIVIIPQVGESFDDAESRTCREVIDAAKRRGLEVKVIQIYKNRRYVRAEVK